MCVNNFAAFFFWDKFIFSNWLTDWLTVRLCMGQSWDKKSTWALSLFLSPWFTFVVVGLLWLFTYLFFLFQSSFSSLFFWKFGIYLLTRERWLVTGTGKCRCLNKCPFLSALWWHCFSSGEHNDFEKYKNYIIKRIHFLDYLR